MENKEMDGSTSSRRLRPLVHPYAGTTTIGVPHGSNSHHPQYSRPRPFQHNPAAAAHFSSQAGLGYQARQLPPSLLSHASAGGAGSSVGGSISMDIVSSSGSRYTTAGTASYQSPSSLLPQTSWSGGGPGGVVFGGSAAACGAASWDPVPTLGGGFGGGGSSSSAMPRSATFQSSLHTCLPSVVGMPALSSFGDLQASSSSLSQDHELPPLPPSLGGAPLLKPVTAVDLPASQAYISPVDDSSNNFVQYDGLGGGLNSCPVASPSLSHQVPAPADAWGKKEAVGDWSSLGTSQQAIASSGSSSTWMSSGNTGLTQAPWTLLPLVPSNSLPALAAIFGGKKVAVDSSWHTPQLGTNNFTSGGSSSAWMPQPAYSSANMVVGSKNNLLSSPGTGWGSGEPGSSILYKDDPSAPFVPEFADGLFTQNDINKIMADKGLKAIVLQEPKKVRSILRNRRTAERSMKRKAAYLSDLEQKVKLLQQQKISLFAQVNSLESATALLTAENNEMMAKLREFEQQTQLKNGVKETLNAEVCRLKLAASEVWGSHVSNSSYQEMSPRTMQQENLQIQDHQLAQYQQELEQLVQRDNF